MPRTTGFLSLEDLASGQGELAICVEFDPDTQSLSLESCTPLPNGTQHDDIAAAYLSLCDIDFTLFHSLLLSDSIILDQPRLALQLSPVVPLTQHTCTLLAIFAGKKYKPVTIKVQPVKTELPSRFRITRNIKGDPLKDMPTLSTHLPPYTPTGRYIKEQKAVIDKVHLGDFPLPEEHTLMHHFMCVQDKEFTWCDPEQGHFRKDFFLPIEILTILQKNIPIPPRIYEEVCKLIKHKLEARVYEPFNSSYRLQWFCVVKKDGTMLHIVHSLEPLNKVTIKHAGVTLFTDQIGKHFAGRACGSMLDLYIGYDKCSLLEPSCDLTTFQFPFRTLRLVTLPMGWTNSIPIFHDDVTCILQPEIPNTTIPYIDDVPIRGPEGRYVLLDSTEECIPDIRLITQAFADSSGNTFKALIVSCSVSSTAAELSADLNPLCVPKRSLRSNTATHHNTGSLI